jgi:VWA-like domain (DUF2201)
MTSGQDPGPPPDHARAETYLRLLAKSELRRIEALPRPDPLVQLGVPAPLRGPVRLALPLGQRAAPDDLLAAALAEVEGLLRAVGMARQLRVLACDTAVGPVRRVSSARQVELVGGGGTDMGAGIEAAGLLRPRPSITVVLTDGFTPWPDEPPRGVRVVVGLLGDDAPDAPDWARAVRVPP